MPEGAAERDHIVRVEPDLAARPGVDAAEGVEALVPVAARLAVLADLACIRYPCADSRACARPQLTRAAIRRVPPNAGVIEVPGDECHHGGVGVAVRPALQILDDVSDA